MPAPDDLAGAGAVLVSGGLTPLYHQALVADAGDWLPAEMPYLGFSAGAAIAADTSLVVRGGAWRVAGAGFAYEVVRDGDGVRVLAHTRSATGR